jgi:hypothetical protein
MGHRPHFRKEKQQKILRNVARNPGELLESLWG